MLPKNHLSSYLDSLGLDDPSKFHTLKRFPILDAHGPIPKQVRDPSKATRENPDGLVDDIIKCDEEDLKDAARNANAMVASARPPFLQIGHTPLKQGMPESLKPKPVGYATHYEVGHIDGKPHLFADLHFRVDHAREAITYPNISVERVNWKDPATHAIQAVSLLRGAPERPIPMVPYESDQATMLVCYSAEMPGPGLSTLANYADDMGVDETADTMSSDSTTNYADEPTDKPKKPEPEPPTKRKTMALEPEERKELHDMFVEIMEKCMAGMKNAKKSDDIADAANDPPVSAEANYAEGMGAMGPNSGYVPGMAPAGDDAKKKADYAKACMTQSNYAKEVPALVAENKALKLKVSALETLAARLEAVEATVTAIDEAHIADQARSMRANYEGIIEKYREGGTIGLDDPSFQQELIEMTLREPDVTKREPFLHKVLANYERSAVNLPMIRQGAPNAKGRTDPAARQARMDWITAHPGRGNPAEDIERYNTAMAQRNGH